jgi:hypothetical protein
MVKVDGYSFWTEKLNSPKLVLAPMVEQSEVLTFICYHFPFNLRLSVV